MKRSITATLLLAALCSCDDKPKEQDKLQFSLEEIQSEESLDQPSGQVAYNHCAAICDLGPRPSNSAGYEAQLRYLEQHLQAAGWKTQRRAFTGAGIPMQNLHATWGEATHLRPLLLSCHIDTKINVSEDFVGANDGASAAAALLEIARMLTRKPQQAEQVEIIFLDGEESFAWNMTEEDGLYGSKWDAQRRDDEGSLPKWQINLDLVGGRDVPIAPPSMDTPPSMYTEYSEAIRTLQFSPEQWTMAPTSYLDDHRPYLDKGVLSLNLIGHFVGSNWWHTPKDDMSIICPNALSESMRMTLQLINQLIPKEEQ